MEKLDKIKLRVCRAILSVPPMKTPLRLYVHERVEGEIVKKNPHEY